MINHFRRYNITSWYQNKPMCTLVVLFYSPCFLRLPFLYICISIIQIFFREIRNLLPGIRETCVYFDCALQNGIEPSYCAALTGVPIVFML